MASSDDKVVSEIISGTCFTDKKLDGKNYFQWKKIIKLTLTGMEKDDHLTKDAPTNAKQTKTWATNDARIFSQMLNSLDSTVTALVTHVETVKELWDYLEVLYSGKDNLRRIYDLSQDFYRAKRKD